MTNPLRVVFLLLICAHLFGAMEYFPGKGKELLLSSEGKIRLLTWNILGLRNDLVAVRPWEERIDGIAQLILSTDADVVILQECFEKGLSTGLYERLKGKYAHFYFHLEEEKVLMPSGLALFSKLPVSQFRFTPHPDLLDGERGSKMGTLDFLILNREKKPIAHIAGSHFQGSSGCEWRVGLTEDQQRLSYPEVRNRETEAALKLLATPEGVPSYLCGDLNVDRRSVEFYTSRLNPQIYFDLLDHMSPVLRMEGTNTNFWKHEAGLARMFSSLTQQEVLQLAIAYKKLYEDKLIVYLNKDPWNHPISDFKPSDLTLLKKQLDLNVDEQKIWKYFQLTTIMAIANEKQLWKENHNMGEFPPVTIGRLIEVRVVPCEESLDFILGTNQSAIVDEVKLLQGYTQDSFEKTLSDHHPLVATLRVSQEEKLWQKTPENN